MSSENLLTGNLSLLTITPVNAAAEYCKEGKFGAKLKPSKVVVILNNPLVICSCTKFFTTKCLKQVNSPNIFPTQLSCYTVFLESNLLCNTKLTYYHHHWLSFTMVKHNAGAEEVGHALCTAEYFH